MRWLFWTHRWLGIVTCLLCAMWLVSGLVMVYVPYPSWRDDERTAFLPPIDATRISVLPGEALTKAGLTRAPTVFRLEMWAGEPVYRIVDFERHTSISAVDGREIKDVGAEDARRNLATDAGARLTYLGGVDADQWTVTRRFTPHRPLHLFEAADGRGTRYYVSSRTGEVVQCTTRTERIWNWLGSVPHWLYFTALRSDPGLWRDVILWTAGIAALGSALGIWIGILRVRIRHRYGGRRISPYRGIMKWHHISGLAGGAFLTAWLSSGWLSVGPFGVFSTLPVMPDQLARYYLSGKPAYEIARSALVGRIGGKTKEVQFTWVGGEPLLVTSDGTSKAVYGARDGAPVALAEQTVIDAARRVFDDSHIASVHRIDAYDSYWYAHRSERPLPALRMVFDNPGETWLTADLATGRIVGASDASDRWHRWLFNFVHLYDHPALLARPLLRELLIWLLSLAGFVVSVTGTVVGVRSLRTR